MPLRISFGTRILWTMIELTEIFVIPKQPSGSIAEAENRQLPADQ
jgi:hypothetical protein